MALRPPSVAFKAGGAMAEVEQPSFSAHARLALLAATRGDAPLVLDAFPDGAPLTYATAADQARRLATVLRSCGVGPSDRILLRLDNRWEFLATMFAASMLGAVVVPVSPRATADDLAFAVEQTEPMVAVIQRGTVAAEQFAEFAPSIRTVIDVDRSADEQGVLSLATAVAAADPLADPVNAQTQDLLAVLYTSGITGWPNGVMLTQGNLRYAGLTYAKLARLQATDRVLISLPLGHVAALGNMAMGALWSGAPMGFVPAGSSWIATARSQGSTMANLASMEIRRILAAPAEADESNQLRLVVFGPAIERAERERFEARFGTELRLGYGMTEAVAPIAFSNPGMPSDYDSVGEAVTPQCLKVVDADGQPVPPGTPGRLLVAGERGVTLAAGYFSRPELSERVFGTGWLDTGDRVVLELDGRVRFLGREVDLVKPSLITVSLAEVQRVLAEHVGVDDAATLGVPDGAGGEMVAAFVVLSTRHPDLSSDELLEWMRGRLSEEKLPQVLRIVESLPYSAMGKVLRKQLWPG